MRTNFPPAVVECFNAGTDAGIVPHSHVREIMNHSSFVNFMVRSRTVFMSEFDKYKGRHFPGIDGESLFVGTIMHSLDHMMLDRTLRYGATSTILNSD